MNQSIGHALALVGIAATSAAWCAVAWRGIIIWRVMPPVLAALGVATLIWGDVELAGPAAIAVDADLGRSVVVAVATGALVGIALFVATRIVYVPLSRWGRFSRDAQHEYEAAATRSRRTGLAFAFISAASEELFWRGWVQPELLVTAAGAVGVALLGSWGAYVVANLLSRSLVLVMGAVVGGAVWVAVGAATGGVAAPLACHVVWTLAMIALPPGTRRSMMSP